MGYWLGGRGFDSQREQEIILFSTMSRPALGPIFNGDLGSFPGDKASIPPYAFTEWCQIVLQNK
jgi:hypothetical protein